MGRLVLRNVPPAKTMAVPVSIHFACGEGFDFLIAYIKDGFPWSLL